MNHVPTSYKGIAPALYNNMHLDNKSPMYFTRLALQIPANTVPADFCIFWGDIWTHLHIQLTWLMSIGAVLSRGQAGWDIK